MLPSGALISDILRDLSWAESGATLALAHEGIPAKLAHEDLYTYLQILSEAVHGGGHGPTPSRRLVVTFPATARAKIEELLRS